MPDLLIWTPGMTLDEVEKQVILTAHVYYRSVKAATAQGLGISVRTLDTKLALYEEQQATTVKRRSSDLRQRLEFVDKCRNGALAQGIKDDPEEANEQRRQLYSENRKKGLGENGVIREKAAESDNQSESVETQRGTHVESAAQAAAQPAVPMPQRGKVQEMLPSKTAASGSGGRR